MAKCNKLMKEALDRISPDMRKTLNAQKPKGTSGYIAKAGFGIDINSKLVTALNKLINKTPGGASAKIDPKSLYNRLIDEGVSKQEISFLPKRLFMSKIELGEIKASAERTEIKINKTDSEKYNTITYNGQGYNNSTYQIRTYNTASSKQKITDHDVGMSEGQLGHTRSHIGTIEGVDGEVLHATELQSDWAQTDADSYPIEYSKFKKLAIVDLLDRTIKEGLDTMIIPIERTKNNLAGTRSITAMYRDLNNGILPSIKRELSRKGLQIGIKHVKGKFKPLSPADKLGELSRLFGSNKISTDVLKTVHKIAAKAFDEGKDIIQAIKTSKDIKLTKDLQKILSDIDGFVESDAPEYFKLTIKTNMPPISSRQAFISSYIKTHKVTKLVDISDDRLVEVPLELQETFENIYYEIATKGKINLKGKTYTAEDVLQLDDTDAITASLYKALGAKDKPLVTDYDKITNAYYLVPEQEFRNRYRSSSISHLGYTTKSGKKDSAAKMNALKARWDMLTLLFGTGLSGILSTPNSKEN